LARLARQRVRVSHEIVVDGPWQFDGQPDRLVVGERAAPCVASSALIGFEYEIPVDDHTHRKSRPDREHRLDVEIAADDLLAGLVDALGCALTQSRNESALGSGLIDQSQKATAAAMQIAEK
jgi:hypothetical protein